MQLKSILAVLLIFIFAPCGTAVCQTKAPAQTAAASDAFKDNGDGTVTDKNMGLMWQKDDDGRQRNWDDSRNYCNSLSLGGHSDWRLPTLHELTSLWKTAASQAEIRKRYFPSMKSSEVLYPGIVAPYWSSNSGGSNVLPDSSPDEAGFVNFSDGSVDIGTKHFFAFYSRCARRGK